MTLEPCTCTCHLGRGKIALTIPHAAQAIDTSVQAVRRAVDKLDLVTYYPTTRPVLLVEDLTAWLKSRPTERPLV